MQVNAIVRMRATLLKGKVGNAAALSYPWGYGADKLPRGAMGADNGYHGLNHGITHTASFISPRRNVLIFY